MPEADWKRFRQVRESALERLCQRVLEECQAISADPSRSAYDRYLAIYELIHERDRDIANGFNNPRRSTAVIQLSILRSLDLVTPEEVAQFSPPIQAATTIGL
ncbi:MAG: peptide ABC transporter substrate-binding protein [Leptolyngbya sp. LCM1.Bin17]|nr:MAG: peptide ABC transporter substrate-binding protein [Leptolyngbya sp. LCM1.Bin17]